MFVVYYFYANRFKMKHSEHYAYGHALKALQTLANNGYEAVIEVE